MSTQYRLVQSGKTASGGCSAGQGSSEPVAPRIYFILFFIYFFAHGTLNKIYKIYL
jgi:carbohydrate-binding DOMON domain-containing protein